MRTIRKGPEPKSLVEYRLSGGTRYDDFRDTQELRIALVREQRGLCCYCMGSISESGPMKIEHWRSQSKHPERQLEYANLLGACRGNEGLPRLEHCDTSKKNHDLSRNPANPEHAVERIIRYQGDGKIVSTDPQFDLELNSVLNLNLAFLKSQRRSEVDALKKTLLKRGNLKRAVLLRLLEEWNGNSLSRDLKPYCQVIVYFLRKRLARP